ncbi:MAG: sugar phosphate nucleotidyltransferase [Deltaproteobacteria bacterium]|nr:sugar phosphate nucleotidyltransferase [Deltaproteobacteria bacterium]
MKICAYVLCAGLGTRLKPLTEKTPKPLVKVQDKTCLDWIVEKICQTGINQIFVNSFHLKEQIEEHLKSKWPTVTIIEEHFLSGTGGAIRANRYLENFDGVLVHNGDILSSTSLSDLISFHVKKGFDVTLACNSAIQSRYISFFNERLCGWGNSQKRTYFGFISSSKRHFLGIHFLSGSVLKFFYNEKTETFSIFDIYLKYPLNAGEYFDTTDFWIDIGTIEDLHAAEVIEDLADKLGLVNTHQQQ